MFGLVRKSEFESLWREVNVVYGSSFHTFDRSAMDHRIKTYGDIAELTARIKALEDRVEDTVWDLMPNAMRHDEV